MKTIHLIPYAGLGNRMRVISSVYNFAIKNSYKLVVHWNREKGLNSNFYSLFENIEDDTISIRDCKISDYFLYNHPNKLNLYSPFIFDSITNRKSFYGINVDQLENIINNSTFEEIIISSYSQQGSLYPLSKLFKPNESIMNLINEVKQNFTSHTIGCHIRRTDNLQAKETSDLSLFQQKIENLIQQNNNAKVFLCTDDSAVKEMFINKFGTEHIITYNSTLNRYSKTGIRDAVVELFLLGSTNTIWGSYYSSYTEMASSLFGSKLIIIK